MNIFSYGMAWLRSCPEAWVWATRQQYHRRKAAARKRYLDNYPENAGYFCSPEERMRNAEQMRENQRLHEIIMTAKVKSSFEDAVYAKSGQSEYPFTKPSGEKINAVAK